jgi:aminomethyltransferase
MPVQYTIIIDEHHAVRKAVGIFDISHMGEVRVAGEAACDFLNSFLTNDAKKLSPGQAQYSLMCNEQGGVVDDLYVYCLTKSEFLIIINASRIEADVPWMQARFKSYPNKGDLSLENLSDAMSAVAVQGPAAVLFIDRCLLGKSVGGTAVSHPSELKKNEIAAFMWEGTPIWTARTGYTGEDGFEIVAPNGLIEAIWNKLLDEGRSHGLKPAGLGARDTLRTEMGYPLYGHELDEQTTPIEAGLSYFVALDKGDFVGRSVLAKQKAEGVSKRCIAFKMSGKSAPPRPHYPIWSSGPNAARIGEVVSGTQSPSLNHGIGFGYVPPGFAKLGTQIEIEIRGQRACAEVVKKPIYRKAV